RPGRQAGDRRETRVVDAGRGRFSRRVTLIR
ncbi:MAG: hypothetical protein QOF38_4417, partial [Pseudonocardiales bacterium]|nr:hypothetical protein [Pseudonocardiales bacterium]